MQQSSAAEIGHNQPPDDAGVLHIRLEEENRDIVARRDELLAAVDRIPAEIDNEDLAGKVAGFIKQIAACSKAAEAKRVGEKEPFLAQGRSVDGFFKSVTDPLGKAKREITHRLTLFQRRQAEEERRRREAEEARQREEAERLAREAAEREASAENDEELAVAISAEELARQADADVEQARQDSNAKAADMSKIRDDHGAVSSLRTFWDFADLDRNAIDLDALRHHLSVDAIEKAVRAYAKAGGRELRGVRIFENTRAAVR